MYENIETGGGGYEMDTIDLNGFRNYCRKFGGNIKKVEEGYYECEVNNPTAGKIAEVFSDVLDVAREGKIPEVSTLFTSGGSPEKTDFAIYSDPNLIGELVRVRFKDNGTNFEKLWINKKLNDLLEEEI